MSEIAFGPHHRPCTPLRGRRGTCSGVRSTRIAAALALALAGCSSDGAVAPPPTTDVSQMFWALTLDHHAVTLSTVSPYDTIRLTATPRRSDGTPLTGLPAPTFISRDLDRAVVDSDGLVHVYKTGNNVMVVATLTVGNIRHADTAYINVTSLAAPPVLASLSIDPRDLNPSDSTKRAYDVSLTLRARAKRPDSTAIAGLAVYYTSTDPTIATIDRATGMVDADRPGHVAFIATATAYGVTRADTLPFVFGYPSQSIITIETGRNAQGQTVGVFAADHVTIGPGGTVFFQNPDGPLTDVTFDDPANVAQNDLYCALAPILCGTGNIEAFSAAQDQQDTTNLLVGVRVRRLPLPGTYTYHSTIFGTTGTIVVAKEPDDIP
jgi:plastocyanin